MKYILTILYITLTTLGIFFMKLGGNNPLSISLSKGFTLKIGYISILGFLFYICSFLLWQKLLVSFDLSYIVPITTGISQIIICLIGFFFFKENINLINVAGIIFLVIGILLISIKH